MKGKKAGKKIEKGDGKETEADDMSPKTDRPKGVRWKWRMRRRCDLLFPYLPRCLAMAKGSTDSYLVLLEPVVFFLCCLFLDGQRSLQLCFYHGSVSVNLVFNALVYIKQFFGFLQFSFRSNGITWCKDFLMVRFFYCLLFSTSQFKQRIVSPSRIHDFTGFHELGSLYDHFYSVNQQCWFTMVCNVSPMFLKDF